MSDKNLEGVMPSSSSGIDYSSMSDEEVLNMPFPSFGDDAEASESAEADEQKPEAEEQLEEVQEEHTEELEEIESEDEDDVIDEELEEDSSETITESDDEDEDEIDTGDSEVGDYEAKYKELMAPFRANGKDIKVDTPEDLRRLAQMGVGYNAKMAELKPMRKIMKMLENEGLLEESKLNYLIDLSKHNPDAITKLVKDSGTNPLDLDTESTDEYKPNTYTVNDSQLALDEALDDLERTSSGQRVIDVVSNKWDKSSKQVLVSNPAYMRQLQEHVDSGVYDQVMNAVEREKLFGRIPSGVSDLEAYNMIGNQMAQAGAFNSATTPAENPQKKAQDTKRTQRKRAAASPKGKKPANKQVQTNLLSMSDEEFEKTLMSKYM